MKPCRIIFAVLASMIAASYAYLMYVNYEESQAREELKPLLGVTYGGQPTSPRVVR